MKSLFNDNETYSKDGNDLDTLTRNKIQPLIEEYFDKGYSIRDIGIIITTSVGTLISELILRHQVKLAEISKLPEEIDLDGMIFDNPNVKYIGKFHKQSNGEYFGLANVNGSLCRVACLIENIKQAIKEK